MGKTIKIATSAPKAPQEIEDHFEKPPLWALAVMYCNYMSLYIFGYLADFCRKYNIGTKKVKLSNSILNFHKKFFRKWPKI
jgi:hypothetical protein